MSSSNNVQSPKSGHPKLKNLRKRLQYKKKKEDTPDVEGPDQLPSEVEQKRKKKQQYFNRASPMKIVRLYKSQNKSHHEVISTNGFGSFLGIKCSKLHPDMCNYLMSCFNHKSCSLEFAGRGSIPITDEVVKKVLGLPLGRYPVVHTAVPEATTFVMRQLGFGDGKQPTLTEVENKLKGMTTGDETYFMLWAAYVVCSLLAPTTGTRICPKCYPAIMDPSKIKDLNWCRFVIMVLIETAKEKGVKNPFKACMLFLEITYIDSLETESINVNKNGPRICAWNNKSVTKAIEQDLNADGSFGRLPLKKCFRQNSGVLLSSIPERIEKFVKANAPLNCGEDEMTRYRAAASELYSDIDVAIAKFTEKVTTINSTQQQQDTSRTRPSTSGSSKRKRKKQFLEDEAEGSDSDYQVNLSGIQSDAQDTSLDDESFGCKAEAYDSDDDDFVSVLSKRKLCSRVVQQKKSQQKKLRRNDACTRNVFHSHALPVNVREPSEVIFVAEQHHDNVVATSVNTGTSPKPSKTIENKKRKAEVTNSHATTYDKSSDANVPQGSKCTAVGDHSQVQIPGIQVGPISTPETDIDVQVEQKVVNSALENLKLYASDSQSSNDIIGCEVTANPPTAESRTVALSGRGFLKQTEGYSSVHAIREVTNICTGIDLSDARAIHVKLNDAPQECSVASSGKTASLTKKSVSWAADIPVDIQNQQSTQSVHPLQDLHTAQGVETSALPLLTPIVAKESPTTIARRPVTRSISPFKEAIAKSSVSPVTRSKTRLNPQLLSKEIVSSKSGSPISHNGNNSKDTTTPASHGKVEPRKSLFGKKTHCFVDDTTTKKLDFESSVCKDTPSLFLPGEGGFFDLGIDSPNKEQAESKDDPTNVLPVITSSNEDEFYGPSEDYELLAAQMGEKYFPTTSGASHPVDVAVNQCQLGDEISLANTTVQEGTSKIVALEEPASKTPIPHAHQKRVIKPAKTQLSPFMQQSKNTEANITQDSIQLYNTLCQHVLKEKSHLKSHLIIDFGTIFIHVPDLADSVKPEGWLSNSTCEIAIHILSQEMEAQKKFVMPLIIANKLRDHAFNGKDIKKVFAFKENNRLDHKEQVMFPVLQNLSTINDPKYFCGHYYLINLNIKAERFEIMDSLRKQGDKQLKADSANIISSIKTMWAKNYKQSNVTIENYETVYIPSPKQLTPNDCGYSMLKIIEHWNGRKMGHFDQKDMPKYRISYTFKWLDWWQNKISWRKMFKAKT